MVAGSMAFGLAGCNSTSPPTGGASATSTPAAPAARTASADMHACAGLNGCKGQGAEGKNACAGQGGCATAAMQHECKGHNACKGQGGCGEMMAANECKGQGGCAVPVKDPEAWKKAREKFEAKMKMAGKKVGPAPAPAKS